MNLSQIDNREKEFAALDAALAGALRTSTLPGVAEAMFHPEAGSLSVRYFDWLRGSDLEFQGNAGDGIERDSRRCGLVKAGGLDVVVVFSKHTFEARVDEVLIGGGARAIASTLQSVLSSERESGVEADLLLLTAAQIGLIAWVERGSRGSYIWPCNPARFGLRESLALTKEGILALFHAKRRL